jgi:membrane protein YdbS with pleckstrin-like domain
MAPLSTVSRSLFNDLARRAASPEIATLTAHHLMRRGLSVNHTQAVTLGVIVAYAVVIALLWNLPYVRWSLWPFKVRQACLEIESY